MNSKDDSERSEDLSVHTTNPDAPATPPPKAPLTRQQRTLRWFEVITAIMLGAVTVATAWSGYQAARWSGVQSTKYAQASVLHLQATEDTALAGQVRLYDLILVNGWLDAYAAGNTKLADIYEARFRPQFLPVFRAWLALDPFTNPRAPPGPLYMPQYKVSQDEEAEQLNTQAAAAFKTGQLANERSDNYLLNTVFLATVLFLTAIAGNFEWNAVRAVMLAVALSMLLLGLYHLLTYPIK
jgi:hypothetical protein